jgi:hypothetical protein
MMITEFKVGGIYELLESECLYHFVNIKEDKTEYQVEDLAGTFKQYQPGTVLTYIRSVIEVRRDSHLVKGHKVTVPVFYVDNMLVTPYSTTEIMKHVLKEVVDEPKPT